MVGRRRAESLEQSRGTRRITWYTNFVIRGFQHRGLKRLYQKGDASKIHPDQRARVTDVLFHLDQAEYPGDLDLPGYRLHPLKGELQGHWSISISANWRITFRFEDGDAYEVDLVDYH